MKVRYEISDGVSPVRIVEPYIGPDASVTWEKEDAPKFDFKKELKEIVLIKKDFKHFNLLNTSSERCDLQKLNVIVECGLDEFILFSGQFTMSSGKWDLDKCTVKFKITNEDPYKCVNDNDDDVNVLELGLMPQTVKLGVTIGVESYICAIKGGIPRCDETYLETNKWTLLKSKRVVVLPLSIYVRQFLVCDCTYTPSSDWTLSESCSEGKKRYYKKVYLKENEYIDFGDSFNVVNEYPEISQVDNGLKLKDVMQELLSASCPGLTLKSDFFQWNPDIGTSVNYVTQESSKINNLILFQKSDVKRPNVSGNATKAMFSFKKAIEQICNIFNCRYRIEGDNFRIEHLSYFERDFGINLMNSKNKELLKGTRRFSYDETKLPKFEKFEFMESGSIDFVGVPIEYVNNCVNNNEENRSTISAENITTDMMFVLENPEPDGEVSDNGFVLVACDQFNRVLYEDGILEVNTTINNPLSWAHLQRDYYKHGRIFLNGLMNNASTEFLSIVPTIKQDKFAARLNCAEIKNFDPIDQVKASLGWGFVQSAEFKLSKCIMNFDLYLDEIIESGGAPDEHLGDFDEDFDQDFD